MDLSNIAIAIIAVTAPVGIVIAIWGLMQAHLAWVLAKQERRRIERSIPKIEAKYKPTYLEQCGYSPKECEECHLPGDCPLCGAT